MSRLFLLGGIVFCVKILNMETQDEQNFKTRESTTRGLSYVQEFRKWTKEHPGLLKNFLNLLESEEFKNTQEGDTLEQNGIKLTILSKHKKDWMENENEFRGLRLKLEVDGHTFFVKQEKGKIFHKGYQEANSAQKAKELLKELELPNVELYEPQLGYQTKDNSFFVSKWIDLPTLSKYLLNLTDSSKFDEETYTKNIKKAQELQRRERQIAKKLKKFPDVYAHNMFYDEKTDKIILFDL